MKGIVVYYSATGSTQKVAKAIHRGMRAVIECDILPIKKADPKAMAQYDLIAIGSPLWAARETANVRLFIYNLPDMTGKLFVPFCTHGITPSGLAYSMNFAAQKKGLTVIGYGSWYGSVYQVLHMPKPYLSDGHPDEIDLKEAEDFGREMANRALRIAAGETDLIPDWKKYAKEDPLWRVGGPAMPKEDAAGPRPPAPQIPKTIRKVNLEKCLYPECTLCIDNCWVNAIDFSVMPPVFKDHCTQQCSLCDKMCPVGAIEIDEVTRLRRTQHVINMEKCRYPECTLCVDHCLMNAIDFSVSPPVFKWSCEGDDLCWVICPEGAIEITNLETAHYGKNVTREPEHGMLRILREAEAEGKFRPLVSLDEVGWNNLIYMKENTPRFNIKDLVEED